MSSIFNKIIPGKKKGEEKKEEKKVEEKKAETQTLTSHGYAGKSVLKDPLITEKTREMSIDGKYTFEIKPSANKNEVKKEVERRYGVTVEKVNLARKKIRPRQYRGRMGKSRLQKKAIVTLKEGDKIDIFPA